MFSSCVYCLYVGEMEAEPKADFGGKRRVCQEISFKAERLRRKQSGRHGNGSIEVD